MARFTNKRNKELTNLSNCTTTWRLHMRSWRTRLTDWSWLLWNTSRSTSSWTLESYMSRFNKLRHCRMKLRSMQLVTIEICWRSSKGSWTRLRSSIEEDPTRQRRREARRRVDRKKIIGRAQKMWRNCLPFSPTTLHLSGRSRRRKDCSLLRKMMRICKSRMKNKASKSVQQMRASERFY